MIANAADPSELWKWKRIARKVAGMWIDFTDSDIRIYSECSRFSGAMTG